MPTERKQKMVDEIEQMLEQCTIAITTDYKGLTMAELMDLRQKLRQRGMQYKVLKNTLTRIAAEKAGKVGILQVLQGPTGIAFGREDPTESAKVITQYIAASRTALKIRGAVVDERVLSAVEVEELSKMPPKEVLLSRLLGGLNSPAVSLLYLLNAHTQGLLRVLQGRIHQLEGT